MKTGRVAKMFQRDPKTIMKWVDTYPAFFTIGARGPGGNQREYELADLIALNTIRTLVALREEPYTIEEKLTSGYRENSLPPEFSSIEGEKAIAVYAEMSQLKAKYDESTAENVRLREQLKEKDQQLMDKSEEIGKWKTMYRMLKEQGSDD